MNKIITISTCKRETLVDITAQVKLVVKASGITDGLVSLYAQGATAIMDAGKLGRERVERCG